MYVGTKELSMDVYVHMKVKDMNAARVITGLTDLRD